MRSVGQLKRLSAEYATEVQFLFIYCREAHAIDSDRPVSIAQVEQPLTTKERRSVAVDFAKEAKLPFPSLLDNIDDKTSKAYAAMPDRLYLVGRNGKVAYAGGKGPRGFRPNDLKKAIEKELKELRSISQPQDKAEADTVAGANTNAK